MTKKESYWVDRADRRMALAHKNSDKTVREINEAYDDAIKSIKEDIENIFENFAASEGMDKDKAIKLLNERVSQKTIDDIRSKISTIEDPKYKRKLINKLNAQAYKARITRLEALKESIYINSKKIADIELKKSTKQYFNSTKDTYYRNIFDSQKATGYVFEFAQMPNKRVEEILQNVWIGKHYSQRIWDNTDVFASKVENIITSGMMSGKSAKRMAKELSEFTEVGKYASERLIRTETSYIVSMADLEGSKERGTEQLKFTATLDSRTSSECQEHDGSIVDTDKAVPGKNIPPLHCFCRSVMIDIIEGLEHRTRVARDPETGNNYRVPADMKYEDWHKQHVENNTKAVVAEKKQMNLLNDKKQHEEYKHSLEKSYHVKSLDEFQNIKYGGGDEYGIIKAQAKGMSYYNKALLNEPEITDHVRNVANLANMDMAGLEKRIKAKDTYLDKIRRKYKPGVNEYEVKDIIRYTYIENPNKLVEKTIKSIEEHKSMGYNTVRVKNYWLNKQNPYNGINTIIKAPNGQNFELQYHTPESYKVKDKTHSDFEKYRQMDKSSIDAQTLRKEMFNMSKGMTVPQDIKKVR